MKDEIKSLLENYGANNLDIYPAAWNGIERNEWQDGWNDAAALLLTKNEIDLSDKSVEFINGYNAAILESKEYSISAIEWYNSLDKYQDLIDELLLNEQILLFSNQLPVKIVMVINSSDVFAWGYSDFEEITIDEIPEISEAFKTKHGIDRWICKKHNSKPQWPLIKQMVETGEWDSEMQNLPDNEYNKSVGWPQGQ
jgi:hypothetical protein